MRLYLIRHGQTESNVKHLLDTAYPGAPLNSTGLAQARELADRLGDEPIEAVYASNLTRAQQTAAPLAEARGVEVQTLDGLREIAAGVEELNPVWDTYIDMLRSWSPSNMDSGLEGGETARQFVERYFAAIAHMASAGHDVAAAVSHGAALRVFGLTINPDLDPEVATPLGNTQWILLDGSPTDGWRIVSWGETHFD